MSINCRKVLFPEWGSLGQDFVVRALEAAGYEVNLLTVPMAEPDAEKRGELAEHLVRMILTNVYEFVFTVNFLPVVAIACKACGIRYVSWVYDSPCVEVYSETAGYDTNNIFIFDRKTYHDLCEQGIKTVYYLPLAADVDYYDRINLQSGAAKSEISFVGSLYTKIKDQFAPLENTVGYLRGYLDGLIQAQTGLYGANFLEQALTPGIVVMMQALCLLPQRVNSKETLSWLYANYYLAKKVTARERCENLKRLSEQFKLKLYTDSSTAELPGIINMGLADYYLQAPVIFRNSKINLNITLRSIQSGIPLRAFDIMGCRGFLLSNYQEDFLEFFIPGEDFIYFENQEDLISKAEFYLHHEEERKRIAGNAYYKVKRYHTYHHRIAEILRLIT